jgi:hypothetical protein
VKRRQPWKSKTHVLDDREGYLVAKALTMAVAVLNHERPFRQGDDIKDMNALLKKTGLEPAASALFERELEIIERASDVIQQESAKTWANGYHAKRSRPIANLFRPPRQGTADEE